MPEVRIVKAEPGLVGGLNGESGEAAERLLDAALDSAVLPRPGSRVTGLVREMETHQSRFDA